MNKKAQSFWAVVIFLIVIVIIGGIIYFVKTDRVLSQGNTVGRIESLGMGDGFMDQWYVLYLQGDSENVYCYSSRTDIESTLNYSKIAGLQINMTYSKFLLRGTFCHVKDRKNSYVITSVNAIEKNPLSSMETGMNYTDDINCSTTKDLELDSQCLRHQFQSFFKYNLSNDKIENLSEFKQNGGVCWHASLWYNDNIQNMGYLSKEIIIDGENVSHQFTIAWDKDINKICILDQGRVLCW